MVCSCSSTVTVTGADSTGWLTASPAYRATRVWVPTPSPVRVKVETPLRMVSDATAVPSTRSSMLLPLGGRAGEPSVAVTVTSSAAGMGPVALVARVSVVATWTTTGGDWSHSAYALALTATRRSRAWSAVVTT